MKSGDLRFSLPLWLKSSVEGLPGGAVVESLPMQGTWVRAPVQEDPTCHGAAGPVSHGC